MFKRGFRACNGVLIKKIFTKKWRESEEGRRKEYLSRQEGEDIDVREIDPPGSRQKETMKRKVQRTPSQSLLG